MYRLLSNSCSGGPCPTFHTDDTTGDVAVQGYTMISPVALPPGEDIVHIPADAWARLLMNLPARQLLAALLRRPVRARVMSGSR